MNEVLRTIVYLMGWVMVLVAATIVLLLGPGHYYKPQAAKHGDNSMMILLFMLTLFLLALGAFMLWLTWPE